MTTTLRSPIIDNDGYYVSNEDLKEDANDPNIDHSYTTESVKSEDDERTTNKSELCWESDDTEDWNKICWGHSDDFYGLLGISKSASNEEIAAAFRRLSRMFHPDKHCTDAKLRKQAEIVFAKIRNAYNILSDVDRRKIYDVVGADGLKVLEKGLSSNFDEEDHMNSKNEFGFTTDSQGKHESDEHSNSKANSNQLVPIGNCWSPIFIREELRRLRQIEKASRLFDEASAETTVEVRLDVSKHLTRKTGAKVAVRDSYKYDLQEHRVSSDDYDLEDGEEENVDDEQPVQQRSFVGAIRALMSLSRLVQQCVTKISLTQNSQLQVSSSADEKVTQNVDLSASVALKTGETTGGSGVLGAVWRIPGLKFPSLNSAFGVSMRTETDGSGRSNAGLTFSGKIGYNSPTLRHTFLEAGCDLHLLGSGYILQLQPSLQCALLLRPNMVGRLTFRPNGLKSQIDWTFGNRNTVSCGVQIGYRDSHVSVDYNRQFSYSPFYRFYLMAIDKVVGSGQWRHESYSNATETNVSSLPPPPDPPASFKLLSLGVQTSVQVGTFLSYVRFTVSQTFSALNEFSVTVLLSNVGLTLRLRLRHGKQALVVPIRLFASPHVDLPIFIGGAIVFPAILLGLTNLVVVGPYLRRRYVSEIRSRREQLLKEFNSRRAAALEEQSLMSSTVANSYRRERSCQGGGLLIECALYGTAEAVKRSLEKSRSLRKTDEAQASNCSNGPQSTLIAVEEAVLMLVESQASSSLSDVLCVTEPLQAQVVSSKIELPGPLCQLSALPGFYDPSMARLLSNDRYGLWPWQRPARDKTYCLWVRYTFRHQLHEHLFVDTDISDARHYPTKVRLPVRSHLVS